MAINVEIALLTGLGGGQDQYFTLDDPTRGVLDNTSYLYAYFDVFATVTSDVRRLSVNRGRSQELDRVNAGQCTIELNNHDRLYDPVAGTAVTPYGGNIVPRKAVRVDVDGLRIFTGQVEDWGFTYQVGGDSLAQVEAVDGFALLGQAELAGGTFTSELTGARMGTVLSQANVAWPLNLRNIATGQATLAADAVQAGANALQYLQQVELSEPGLVFMNTGGTFTFRDRTYTQTAGTLAFTDVIGSGIPYTSIEVEYGTEQLHNRIRVTYPSGTSVAEDATSQGAYGVVTRDFQTLLSSSTQGDDMAGFLLGKYKDPTLRVRKLGIMLSALAPADKASVLGLDLGDVVRVVFTPNKVGSAINRMLVVDGISHDIEPRAATSEVHRMMLTLSATETAFILDDSSFGVLDGSNGYGF